MATFIQGLTDTNPSLEYYAPDKEFVLDFLTVKQGQFNQAKSEFNDVYSSLKSIDLTLDENRLKRDEFIKLAEQEIKKLANVDISMPQNLAAAKRIFNPLVEDQDILTDMRFTTQVTALGQAASKFKNSANEEDRKRYNPISLQYAQLKQEEFKDASPEKRAQMAASGMSYASNINLMDKATVLAKEMDLSVSLDELTGAYKLTTKNGELVAPALEQAFFQSFSNDPEVQDYYQQRSYVDVQSAIQMANQFTDYNSAVLAVGQEYQTALENSIAESRELIDKDKTRIEAKIKEYETLINAGKIIEGDERHQNYLSLKNSIGMLNASQEQLDALSATAATAFDTEDELYEKAYTTTLLEDIQGAAGVLSQRDASKSMSLDDLFKLQYNRETDLIKEGIQGTGGTGPKSAADIHQSMRNQRDRGADLTYSDLGGNAFETATKMFAGYKDENFEMFENTVKDYLSIPGSSLSQIPSTATKREVNLYLQELKNITDPAERARVMSEIFSEIKSSPLITVESGVIDDLNYYALHSSQLAAAKKDFDTRQANAINTLLNSGEFDAIESVLVENFMFNSDGTLKSLQDVINSVESSYQSGQLDKDTYKELYDVSWYQIGYSGLDTPSQTVETFKKVKDIYNAFVDEAGALYGTDPVTMADYFDAEIFGKGSGDARRSIRNYRYDPKQAFNPKEDGHEMSLRSLETIGVIQNAAGLGGSYAIKGTMREQPILGAEELPEDVVAFGAQTSLDYMVLSEVMDMAEKSGKSTTDKRPVVGLDVIDNVMVGDERYVVAQFKIDNETMAELKKDGSKFSEDNIGALTGDDEIYEDQKLKDTFTVLVPEKNINSLGIHTPTAGDRMMLASIKQNSKYEIIYPELGTVTYTYDEENDRVTVSGTIKSLDENGDYGFNTYVQSADVYQFSSLNSMVKEALVAIETQNQTMLDNLRNSRDEAGNLRFPTARIVK